MGDGVTVECYSIDNCTYTSNKFTRELHVIGQEISHSGVGGHHHNRVAENSINNVVRIAITMVIHDELKYPDASENSLFLMAMDHAIYLHNHGPHISRALSSYKVWTSSKSSHSALHNAHPWGYPAYVLEPRLRDGNKLPN